MKKLLRIIAILLVLNGTIVFTAIADPPDPPNPPNPGGSPAGNGNPVGAPIDGGMGSVFILCAMYGARKIYSVTANTKSKKF